MYGVPKLYLNAIFRLKGSGRRAGPVSLSEYQTRFIKETLEWDLPGLWETSSAPGTQDPPGRIQKYWQTPRETGRGEASIREHFLFIKLFTFYPSPVLLRKKTIANEMKFRFSFGSERTSLARQSVAEYTDLSLQMFGSAVIRFFQFIKKKEPRFQFWLLEVYY